MSDQIPALPQGLTAAALTTALNDRIRRINLTLGSSPAVEPAATPTAYGTHAQRVGRPLPADASIFTETDRNGLVYQIQGRVWVYVSGTYQRTQTQLAALAATLGSNDTGLLVDVTDFAHVLRWTGTAWTYADPSDPAGRIEGFLVDPSPTTGWALCDGTAGVPYLMSDGTLGMETLPDLISAPGNAAYFKFGSPASNTVNPAVAPLLTMDSYTPTGVTGSPTFTGIAVPLSTGAFTTTGSDAITSVGGSTTSFTPAGTVASAAFTGTPTTLTGTIDATGEPQNFMLRPWFRT